MANRHDVLKPVQPIHWSVAGTQASHVTTNNDLPRRPVSSVFSGARFFAASMRREREGY